MSDQQPTAEPGRVPEPRQLLDIWMGWEKGETTPGKTLSDLKAKGMRDLLDALAKQIPE
jgi:transposase-like protein